MDYLEGLFLGKLWSDTDYENRRHYMLFVLYGLLVDLLFLTSYMTGKNYASLGMNTTVQIVFLVILFIACPVLCFRYYRIPLWGKILVLLEKTFKTIIVMNLTIHFISPYITIQSDNLQDYLVNYLNSTLETYTQKFAYEAGSFATVMGVLTGGIHVVLVFVFALVAAVVIPGLIYIAFRYIQFGYDYIINALILKRYFKYRR